MMAIRLLITVCFLLRLGTETASAFRNHRVSRPSLARSSKSAQGRPSRWLSALSDDLDIGAQLLGEVYEHDADNLKDPRILFNVKGRNGENLKGALSTRNLSWQERMTLQVGAMMRVNVIGKENDELLRLSLIKSSDAILGQASAWNERGTQESQRSRSAVRTNPVKMIPTRSNQKGARSGLRDEHTLLNKLKTGMELEGTITSCTAYAVFVDAGVMRAGKGGSFVPVNGMLHQNDMPAGTMIRSSNNRRTKNREADEGDEEDDSVLSKGKRVTVYVKEVYKNSGRITFTLNPAIEKSQILAEKEKIKADGNERRRARRMRRILEDIAVGDTIIGTVDRVVSEGVLVTMEMEGASLPITGLMSKRDLPKQFQVPPDLKDSFQKQLLEQDFVPGREVTCGVYRVNNKSNGRMKYNLKLTFEEFGSLPNGEVEVPDSALESFGATSTRALEGDDDDDKEKDVKKDDNDSDTLITSLDEEDAWEDADTREIFDELRGDKPLVAVADLFDWADVQDMVEDGDITEAQINQAVKEVVSSDSREALMTFTQFAEVISIMQDTMARGALGSSLSSSPSSDNTVEQAALLQQYLAAGDDEDDDNEDDVEKTFSDALPTADAVSASIAEAENYDDAAEDEEDFTFDESLVEGIEDEAVEEVAREIFDDLRGDADVVTFETVRGWSDIEDMVSNNYVSEEDLVDVWASLRTDKADFSQFFRLVQKLEDVAAENEEADGDDARGAITALDDGDKEGGEEYDEIDEEAEAEMLGEIFETLGKGKQTITLSALKKWDDLAELQLESDELLDLLKMAGVKVSEKTGRVSGGISEEQFIAFVRTLDEAEEVEEDEEGAPAAPSTSAIASSLALGEDEDDGEVLELDDYESEEPLTEEENKEIMESLFNTLRGSSASVPTAAFMAWDDVKDLVSEGLLEQENVEILMQEVGCDSVKGSLDLDQFSQLVTLLDETLEALEGQHLNEETDPTPAAADFDDEDFLPAVTDEDEDEKDDDDFEMTYNAKWGVEDGSDELPEEERMSDEQLEKLARDIYDELRGNAKSLPVKKFKKWEEVQDLINNEVVQAETIDALVKAVTGEVKTSTLSFDHFKQLVELLDDAGEAAMGDGGFEGDKKEDMTAVVNSAMEQPNGNSNSFIPTGEEFLEDTTSATASAGTVAASLDDDEDEPTAEEVEEIAREVFDELKSPKTGKLSVKKFQQWESIKEALSAGELSKGALKAAIAQVDDDNGNLNFGQFVQVMELVEEAIDAHYNALERGETDAESIDDEEDVEEMSGKGFAKATIEATQQTTQKAAQDDASFDDDDAESIARTIFDELRGRKTTLSVGTFKEWQDCKDMVSSGQLKLSTLERAIKKVGALDSGEMSYKQFSQLIDIIQKDIDQADLMGALQDDEDDLSPHITSSRKAGVMAVSDGDEDDEYGNIDEDSFSAGQYEPMNEEEELQSIYDELRGSKDTLPLVDFLKWEDVQELLEIGAVSKDALAECIEKVGVTVEDGDLSQEQFGDLIELLDGLVDQSKLVMEEGDIDLDDLLDKEHDSRVLLAPNSDDDTQTALEASLDMLLGEDSEQEAQEVREMFEDLAKGKEEISQKQLRKWDELQELVDAGLTNKDTIDRYVDKLDLAEDEGVTFPKFQLFISYLDRVLLDEGGEFLDGGDGLEDDE